MVKFNRIWADVRSFNIEADNACATLSHTCSQLYSASVSAQHARTEFIWHGRDQWLDETLVIHSQIEGVGCSKVLRPKDNNTVHAALYLDYFILHRMDFQILSC